MTLHCFQHAEAQRLKPYELFLQFRKRDSEGRSCHLYQTRGGQFVRTKKVRPSTTPSEPISPTSTPAPFSMKVTIEVIPEVMKWTYLGTSPGR